MSDGPCRRGCSWGKHIGTSVTPQPCRSSVDGCGSPGRRSRGRRLVGDWLRVDRRSLPLVWGCGRSAAGAEAHWRTGRGHPSRAIHSASLVRGQVRHPAESTGSLVAGASPAGRLPSIWRRVAQRAADVLRSTVSPALAPLSMGISSRGCVRDANRVIVESDYKTRSPFAATT